MSLARFVHSWAQRLVLPLNLARLWWGGRREPLLRSHWRERLGFGAGAPGAVWIHAATRADVGRAAALMAELRGVEPNWFYLLTHGTAGAREAGALLVTTRDRQAWLPVDTPGAVRRFMRRQRPLLGVLMRSGVRPNLFHAASVARVPLVMANAHLSEIQLRDAKRQRALIEPAMRTLALVLAPSEADSWHLGRAGAHHVRVTGELDFDCSPAPRQLARGLQWRGALPRPVVLAACLTRGEEMPLLQAWCELPTPRPLLLLVPDDAQRSDDLAELVRDFRLQLRRRSAFADSPDADAGEADVWLGDRPGEMALNYALADVALLGGSFAGGGDARPVEALACGCPLLIGPKVALRPHLLAAVLESGAAQQVSGLDEALQRAAELASDPARNHWVAQAFAFNARHRGAAKRMAAEVLALMVQRRMEG